MPTHNSMLGMDPRLVAALQAQSQRPDQGLVPQLLRRAQQADRDAGKYINTPAERDPGFNYGSVLPFRKPKEGGPAEFGMKHSDLLASLLQALSAPGRAYQGENVDSRDAMNVGLSVLGTNAAVGPRLGPGELGANVFHGSPHRFEPTPGNPLGEFNAGKIGTGEGAQAVAYGHYVAENQGVAKDYARTLSQERDGPLSRAVADFGREKKDHEFLVSVLEGREPWPINQAGKPVSKEWLINQIEDRADSMKTLESLKAKRQLLNNVYKADLADESIPKMLQMELPLEKQTAELRKIIEGSGLVSGRGKDAPFMKGDAIYQRAVQLAGSPEAASAFLRDLGIPGVSYLDAGSRAAGAGSKNYVVFPGNEKLLKILERN